MSAGDHDASSGLDGLTAEELRRSRLGWWDERFTALLLESIPRETRRLLDIGCGLATATHALLPRLPAASYLGIDADANRLRHAVTLLAGTPHASRTRLVQARADQLPCPDRSVDVALSSMTLQHVGDVTAVLDEGHRILREGGRFAAIEPNNLSNEFHFDGPLEEVNTAFRRLFAAQRAAKRPADSAIGSAIPSLLEHHGFAVVDSRPHIVGTLSRLTADELFSRARDVITIVSRQGGLSGTPLVKECLDIVERTAASARNRPGYGGQVVTIFVTCAEKP